MAIVPIGSILDGKHTDKQVTIRGWVYRKRESKDINFILMRDATGVIQCTIKKNTAAWKDAEKVTIESSAALTGTVKEDKRAPGGYEISGDKLRIIGLAENFPIAKDKSEDFLRDVRHLWLRSRRMNLIMRVRDETLWSVHELFRKKGFIEVSPPMFISSAVEGGSTLFGLKYFDQNLYLTQSAQLYLEALIYSLEKVYCVAPSFRAEKSRTIRHLTEYWHVEPEQAFADVDDMMRLEEDLVSYVCQKIAKKCRKELDELKVNADELASVKPPFPRITYTEALDTLHKKGFRLKWGEDFGFNEERALAEDYGKPVFVYAYPKQIKAFYCKTYRDNPDLAMSADLLVPRIGEITTGGSRVDDKAELIQRMKEFGLQPEAYDWYVDLRKYGTVPHAGFGLGVERLIAWMLNLENVMDAIPFPRTIRRFYP
ncbi:MAG TPA: asparagine--tRNA ligase [Candidatus Krumholzibacteriaceae bacterium]|jgi:asparaginyl-tRNA synthetase|nr:asparagine--tRNA ligase [Candidatus Krumholzibacteriaceae bacterium]